MHRLLQGEVGSGKTVVALRAMLTVVDSGVRPPSSHPPRSWPHSTARCIAELLGPLARERDARRGGRHSTRIALLTGSRARRPTSCAAGRRQGDGGIVIGTHALLEERVQFPDLGLVVVDEQHRFGVEQRAALASQAGERTRPHVLVMTATPIPRTVAMTVFGDLETSTLRELPAGRRPRSHTVVPARTTRLPGSRVGPGT